MKPRLLVIGGGRMGSALVGGLVGAGWEAERIGVVEADGEPTAEALAEILPGVSVMADPVAADGAVVAVKPADGEGACRALAATGTPRVLSIMAGVRLARLEGWLGTGVGGGPGHAQHAGPGRGRGLGPGRGQSGPDWPT